MSGEWVNVRKMLASRLWVATCSACRKEHVYEDTLPDACPNCGADMREQEPKKETYPKSTFYDLLYEEGGANTT